MRKLIFLFNEVALKQFILLIIFSFFPIISLSGQVGIGTETPDLSAILEIVSPGNNKGVLLPRLTSVQKSNISSPTDGLLLYQSDEVNGFYVYKNGGWEWLVSSVNSLTHMDDRNNIALGSKIASSSANNSIAIGSNTLSSTTGNHNIAIGTSVLFSNTSGNNNIGVGTQALFSNTTGANNIATGYKAFYSNTTGNNNTTLGYTTLYSNTTASNNTAIGYKSFKCKYYW